MKNDQNIEMKNIILRLNNFHPETISLKMNTNPQFDFFNEKLKSEESNFNLKNQDNLKSEDKFKTYIEAVCKFEKEKKDSEGQSKFS